MEQQPQPACLRSCQLQADLSAFALEPIVSAWYSWVQRRRLTLDSTTNFNVVIAILSVFILLCKIIMTVCGVFHPLISMFAHSGLVAVWAVSIHNQAGPDMSDPAHPQPGAPWYITKSCGPPVKPSLIGYCKQSKAAFAVTIIMMFVSLSFVHDICTDRRAGPSSSHMCCSHSGRLSRQSLSARQGAPSSAIKKLEINRGRCWRHPERLEHRQA